jgi:hypothetical protein
VSTFKEELVLIATSKVHSTGRSQIEHLRMIRSQKRQDVQSSWDNGPSAAATIGSCEQSKLDHSSWGWGGGKSGRA